MNKYEKAEVRRAIAIKIRRDRLTRLWRRASSRTSSELFNPERCNRLYDAMKRADMDNEFYNALCGTRRALIACRFAARATA